MKQPRHSVEQIIAKLRRADVELGKHRKVPEVCKMLEITEQTYYRWRKECGGLQVQRSYLRDLAAGTVSIEVGDLECVDPGRSHLFAF